MSKETSTWLNNNTLIGYTERRGNAWHYRATAQGEESNHYPGAIPVEDVQRRLFDWQPVRASLQAVYPTDSGVQTVTAPDRVAIVRPDTGAILGVFKEGYRVHGYQEWLVQHVETILDADVHVGSAGLLRGGAVAWVQVEMADTLQVQAAGSTVQHRPFLTAATSLDGSLATTYLVGSQVVVCDNTLSAAIGVNDGRVRIKHSSQSLGRLTELRDALGVLHAVGDDFDRQVQALAAQTVPDAVWDQLVAQLTTPSTSAPRAITNARTKRDALQQLYRHDQRVAPWAGTAYGVLAALNTYRHHVQPARGDRAERNALAMVTGQHDREDANALQLLQDALAATR